MKAQDLRIGNIVSCKAYLSEPTNVIEIMHSGDERGNYLRLEGVPHGVWMENKGELIVEGVPLTEDVLVKLGFVKTDDYGDQIYYEPKERENRDYYICFDHDDISFGLSVFGNCTNLLYDDANLQFVHQLQNLYHALTGEELTFNN
jgi:hypothetical protein